MKPVTVHLFNPWHDMALANYQPNYQPPASAVKMAQDLAFLPRWVAREGDLILLPDFSAWQVHGHETTRVAFPQEGVSYEIKPWGWDQLVLRQLQIHFPSLELPSRACVDTVRQLSSRQLAVETLAALHEKSPGTFIGESFFCTDLPTVAALAEKYPRMLMKQLWSSSGKGLRRLDRVFDAPLQNWCSRSISQHGGVVLEPRYERLMDFAMEFVSSQGSIAFCGYSVFLTSDTGKYAGNLLDTDENLERSILGEMGGVDASVLHQLQQLLVEILNTSIAPYYQGPFGVDMMLVRAEDGSARIHPCVEINLRFNMGQLATALSRQLLPEGRKGLFSIEFFRSPQELQERHAQLGQQEGYRPLVPIQADTCYLPYILLK